MDAASLANLASYSAQVAIIVAIGALLPVALRLDAPAVRYDYWRVLTLLCLVLPWAQGRAVRPAPAASLAAGTVTTVVGACAAGATTTRAGGGVSAVTTTGAAASAAGGSASASRR